MKLKLIIPLLVFIVCNSAYGQTERSNLYEIKFKKVKDNVYLAYRPDPFRIYVEGNVTFIINEQDVVVVDTGGSPASARSVIAEIKKLTTNPVRYVINTHFHRDHVLGNQEYLKAFPGVEIISHPVTLEKMIGGYLNGVADLAKNIDSRKKDAETEIKRLRQAGAHQKVIANWEQYLNKDIYTRQAEYRTVILTHPTTTVEKRFVLYRKTRTIEVLSIGHGDTAADLVVYLPQDKIIITGDMVVHPFPYGFSEKPFERLETLNQLSEMEFDTLIPGHGEIQNGKTYVRSIMELLRAVHEQVKSGVDKGLDLEGVRKQTDLSKYEKQFAGDDPVYRYYFKQYFIVPSTEQAFKAKTGQK